MANTLSKRQRDKITEVLSKGWEVIGRYLNSPASDKDKVLLIKDLCKRQIPDIKKETGDTGSKIVIQYVTNHIPEVQEPTKIEVGNMIEDGEEVESNE